MQLIPTTGVGRSAVDSSFARRDTRRGLVMLAIAVLLAFALSALYAAVMGGRAQPTGTTRADEAAPGPERASWLEVSSGAAVGLFLVGIVFSVSLTLSVVGTISRSSATSARDIGSERGDAIELLDMLPIGVVRLGSEDTLDYANRRALEWLGLSGGEDRRDWRHAARNAGLAEAVLTVRHAVNAGSIDCRSAAGAGGRVLQVIRAGSGGGGERSVMISDITGLREFERSRDEYLASITHELRTPLTSIHAYAETLSHGLIDDEATRTTCYRTIVCESQRLVRLIEDILSMARIEAGAVELRRGPLRLRECLRDVLCELRPLADAKPVDLVLERVEADPHIHADRERLHQVWVNLIGNAIKYTPAGGSVSVLIRSANQVASVEIRDTGIGIAAEHHERIFDRFYRVDDPEVREQSGTGLGMHIAQQIVRLHGGRIGVESAPGRGSSFLVELPTGHATSGAVAQEGPSGDDRHR